MPQVNKKEQNEKFATLLLEILDTQRQIIEKLNSLESKGAEGKISSDIWNKI